MGNSPSKSLTILGHSTSGGTLLRYANELTQLDPRIRIVSESPSGIAGNTPISYSYEFLASHANLLAHITRMYQTIASSRLKQLTARSFSSSYNLPIDQLNRDAWFLKSFLSAPADILQSEVLAETSTPHFEQLKHPSRIQVILGKNDPMIHNRSLQTTCDKLGIGFSEIPSAGHPYHRQPKALQEWFTLITQPLPAKG